MPVQHRQPLLLRRRRAEGFNQSLKANGRKRFPLRHNSNKKPQHPAYPSAAQEIPLLLGANGKPSESHDTQHLFPKAAALLQIASAQKIARLMSNHNRDAMVEIFLLLVSGKRKFPLLQKTSGSNHAERNDDFRTHQPRLQLKDRGRIQDLLFAWGSIVGCLMRQRGTELDKVRDVHLTAGKPHSFEHSIQLAPGIPLKRASRLFIIKSRSLTHEHDVCISVPFPKDSFSSQRSQIHQWRPRLQQARCMLPYLCRGIARRTKERDIIPILLLRVSRDLPGIEGRTQIIPYPGCRIFLPALFRKRRRRLCRRRERRLLPGNAASPASGRGHPRTQYCPGIFIHGQILHTLFHQGMKIA